MRLKEVTVTALDQNDQPLSGITIIASPTGTGLRSVVTPSSAITGADGTAKFKFRFGFVTKDGKITFSANGLSAIIEQKN